jgi:hypothetical protein
MYFCRMLKMWKNYFCDVMCTRLLVLDRQKYMHLNNWYLSHIVLKLRFLLNRWEGLNCKVIILRRGHCLLFFDCVHALFISSVEVKNRASRLQHLMVIMEGIYTSVVVAVLAFARRVEQHAYSVKSCLKIVL